MAELTALLREAAARQDACKGHVFETVAVVGSLRAEMCACGRSRVWNMAAEMEATTEDVEAEQWREELRRSLTFVLDLKQQKPTA